MDVLCWAQDGMGVDRCLQGVLNVKGVLLTVQTVHLMMA